MASTPSCPPTLCFAATTSSFSAPTKPTLSSTTAEWSKPGPPPPTRSSTYNGSSTNKDTVGTLFGLTRCRNTWPSTSGAVVTADPSRTMSSPRAFNVKPGHASHAHNKVRVRQDSLHQSRTESNGTPTDTAKDDDKSDDAVSCPRGKIPILQPPAILDGRRAGCDVIPFVKLVLGCETVVMMRRVKFPLRLSLHLSSSVLVYIYHSAANYMNTFLTSFLRPHPTNPIWEVVPAVVRIPCFRRPFRHLLSQRPHSLHKAGKTHW